MSTGTGEAAPHVPVVALVGPTAVGKSAVAELLALVRGAEIVSADSMQIYRGMDIGTAKPPAEERRVPYHCLDLVDPGTPFSAALFQTAARDAIADIAGRGALPLLCGGTGLYVRAALDRWEFPAGDSATPERAGLEAEAARIGPEAMHARLTALDPQAAALIHPSNVRRTIRALEMAAHGASYAAQARAFARRESVYETVWLGMTMERELLYQRIDSRVDAMMESGLMHEVEHLLEAGFRNGLTASQAIGYKELVPVVEGGADIDEAVDAIKRATRRYAKRQLTWFRSDPRIRWLDATGLDAARSAEAALGLLESLKAPQTGRPEPGTWRLPTPG